MSSQDSRRGKGFLGLSDIQADSYLDESVNAPTSKLDNIPLRLSEYLAGKDSEIEDLPLLEENDVSVNYQNQNLALEEIQELEQIEEMSVTDSDKSINLELEELPEFIEQPELGSEEPTNQFQNLQLEELPLIEQPQNSITQETAQFQENFLNTEALQAVFEKENINAPYQRETLEKEFSLANDITNFEDESQQATPVFEVTFDPNSSTGRFEKDSLLKEQLESVDFYIEQGFLDVAFNTLERLEVLFPNHPLISERLEKMASLEIAHTSSGIPIPNISQISTTKETLSPSDQDVMNESMFRVPNTAELPGLADLSTQEETEIDFNSLISNSTSDITPINNINDDEQKQVSATSNIMFEDIPAELYQTITDEIETESDNVLSQMDDAAAEIAAVQHGLKSLIDDEENEAALDEDLEEEFSSRFNVGQAYLDIELYDDAVEEFQAAYRIIQDLGAHPKTFQCCMLLGRCFRLKEMPRPALIWLRKALDTKKYQPNEQVELLYEIANVHEELGEQKKALTVYQEIAKLSPNYQDVTEKIIKLYS